MKSRKSALIRNVKGMRSGSNFRMLSIRYKKALMYSSTHRRKHSNVFGQFFIKSISFRRRQLSFQYSDIANLSRYHNILLDRKMLYEISKYENLVNIRFTSLVTKLKTLTYTFN